MLRQNTVAAVFVCAFAWPALAQDASDFMNGVYASSKEDCDNLAMTRARSALDVGASKASDSSSNCTRATSERPRSKRT